MKAEDRIETIARDVAQHYRDYIEPNGFKAQLVVVDREACALYKDALDQYLPLEYSVVIFTPNPNDDQFLRRFHMSKEDQLKIFGKEGTFQKKGENPKILIVTDMLLTGFDAPIEQVMYLDKPLRDHRLLQAIARTNRTYEGKEAGIIVDYVGIFKRLQKALNFQLEDIEGVAYKFDVLKEEFNNTLNVLLSIFHGVKRDGTRTSLFKAFKKLENEEVYKDFKTKLSKLKLLYETLAPDPFLTPYIDSYTWLLEINEAYNKLLMRKQSDLTEYEEKTKQLIREKLIVSHLDTTLPVFAIDQHYLKRLDDADYSEEERVMELRQSLEHHIKINLETNPIYETLSQRLERILKARDRTQQLQELEMLVAKIVEVEEEAKKSGLTAEQNALINVAKKYLTDIREYELKELVLEILEASKPKFFSGWHRKSKMTNEVEQVVFDVLFQQFSKKLKVPVLSELTEELMKYLVRYNP